MNRRRWIRRRRRSSSSSSSSSSSRECSSSGTATREGGAENSFSRLMEHCGCSPGGLSVNLTEQAFRRLARRVVAGGLAGSAAAKIITASDYCIAPAGGGDGGVPEPRAAAAPAAADAVVVTFEETLDDLGLGRHGPSFGREDIRSLVSPNVLVPTALGPGGVAVFDSIALSHPDRVPLTPVIGRPAPTDDRGLQGARPQHRRAVRVR